MKKATQRTRSKTLEPPKRPGKVAEGADPIAHYGKRQTAEHAAICHALRRQIDRALPKAASKIWHGSPVWFVGENPVVGYHVTAKNGVGLLFWNGRSFGDSQLKPAGKVGQAAQIHFTHADQIETKLLGRWLKRAATDIFDSHGFFLACREAQRKAER